MSFNDFWYVFYDMIYYYNVPDEWVFQRLYNSRINAEGWLQVRYHTKAAFYCEICKKNWKSARTTILFQCKFDEQQNFGKVQMKRFGQQCKDCGEGTTYYPAQYNLDQICRSLQVLFVKVLQEFYGYQIQQGGGRYRRPKTTTPPHASKYCEACHYRVCGQEEE
ncbi:unnamed protein product [Didymodactylos carnosus]|uniref:3CxxC-type domain-containing protein n=1 Tax=Didymodactylos carnosus TaxID=1234261 RepID=A0A8S2LUI4_9BILA|nr:unnamed protein product [Didymodactylos carnosus]CAF3924890.1 unnamed protein product [Didymodactylos carnosus]